MATQLDTRATASTGSTVRMRGLTGTRRVPIGSPQYNALLESLYDEAAALDERRFDDWLDYMAEDLTYTCPIRITRTGKGRDYDVARTMYHFNETKASLKARIGRLDLTSAWAEDPPSRTRRIVTNVRMSHTDSDDLIELVSYLFVTRSRGEDWRVEHFTGERRDIWRIGGPLNRIVTREIIPDQSVLGNANLAIFL